MREGRQREPRAEATTETETASRAKPAQETPQNDLAALCKALGHPLRVEIIEQLKRLECCVCGELVARLPVAQSTVSQHLKVLKDAGLITGESAGPCTHYRVDALIMAKLKSLISDL